MNIVVSTATTYYTASAYVSGAAGGTISPEYTNVPEDGSVTFYITTNPGYVISAIYDSNGVSYAPSNAVTISNIKGDITVGVTFEAEPEPEPSGSSSSASSSSDTNAAGGSTKTS